MVNSTETQTLGWTSSPNTRGTSDILVTCLATTFLCCWTSVYPNIPAPTDTYWARLRDKFGLACLGILGPDFLIMLAMGQRSSARRSFRKFRENGCDEWTLTHSFFADMGGFVLAAPGLERPIPLDAEQLLYLVEHKYIDCPSVTKQELGDRDKSDSLSRSIAVFQATWFVVSLVGRAIQGLAITTIELTTVSFVIILFGTSWCWKDKPSGVQTALLLQSSVHIEEIVASGGPVAEGPWYHTPLDFISRHEPALNVVWYYYNDLCRKIWFSPFSRRVKAKPWDRIPGEMFLWTDPDLTLIGGTFILAFGAIFFIAWNWHFPTRFEQLAWRAASIYMITYGVTGGLWMGLWIFIFLPHTRVAEGSKLSLFEQNLPGYELSTLEHLLPFLRRNSAPYRKPRFQHADDLERSTPERHLPPVPASPGFLGRVNRFLSKTHNISPDKDPHLNIPVGFLLGTSTLCVLYVVFRGYILTEDVVALRALPSSAYQTVDWLSFIPHI